ncbi:MAG: helicase-associated domain-containing protein [Calditrichaeota bacterium]|nr:helicase-associated domain-containing protein [Candidatus Cloacimonadota bacterium]MCA9785007.1 helicase-associated domain-containing protein [Candidatus Cloacimonadota bacterium]MCB1046225.1 helicase-associated domain-containing protein [Calditrichota bacterium]MCB9474228.1 helicase-associated domain-containing protein [Candidatus Delongbacteria bacterium]
MAESACHDKEIDPVYNPNNPLIVQSDKTIFLETANQLFEDARDELARFAELEKSPEHLHTYRLSPLSLWNAASSGLGSAEIISTLNRYSKYVVPTNVVQDIREYITRYGRVKLDRLDENSLVLECDDRTLMIELSRHKTIMPLLEELLDDKRARIRPGNRGHLKQALIKIGFPVEDLAGYTDGEKLDIVIRERSLSGMAFGLRSYQQDAVSVFWAGGGKGGGSGVLVLPCGAGKTVIGIGAMSRIGMHTLILTTNVTALRQWKNEILDKTELTEEQIAEYSGDRKEIAPVTIATYQILTYRRSKKSPFLHFDLFNKHNWGLIVYDEVHLLPAPIFRAVAEIQSRRRLGLTATLVREDNKEDDVFSLIGPKKIDVPWKELERQGWIATANCVEYRLGMSADLRLEYALAETRRKYTVASTNPVKLEVIDAILEHHPDDQVLIIGQFIDQLKTIAKVLDAPLITGSVRNTQRDELYNRFRRNELRILVVSKVANFAIDLPEASVAIQVSGTFGSRQEEAQRLGRVLRPKSGNNQAWFYTLVTRDTIDQEFAMNRQLFLTEQGYRYEIRNFE